MSRKKKDDEIRSIKAIAAKGALWRDVLSRFVRSRTGVVGFVIVIVLLFLVIFAPLLTSYDYAEQSFPERFLYPSRTHIFGTDEFGRDLFSRMLYGGRISLLVAFVATCISAGSGIILGTFAGYFGGTVDDLISRFCEIIMSIPSLLLAIAISAAFGGGPLNTSFAISIGAIGGMARLIRSQILRIKTDEFVEAARVTGANNLRIMFVHILPNAIAPVFINFASNIGSNIMMIAGLSFIGLGVKPPTPEWGAILNAGRANLRDFWPTIFFLAFFIMLTIFAFNLLGDALRDALDPRLKD